MLGIEKKTTGVQFFHIETYAKKQSKNSTSKKGFSKVNKRQSNSTIVKQLNQAKRERFASKVSSQRNLTGIINEANREIGYCDHVEFPLEPILCFGHELGVLKKKVDSLYSHCKTTYVSKDGVLSARKIRSDQHLLLAGVASHPRLAEDYFKNQHVKQMVNVWVDDVISFLKVEYGDSLQSVVLHLDEGHPHVHFYCLPSVEPCEIKTEKVNIVSPIGTIHKGIRAREEAKLMAQVSNITGKEKTKHLQNAFTIEMKSLQDRYFEAVSYKSGHSKYGPKRLRFDTRDEYFDFLKSQKEKEDSRFFERKKRQDELYELKSISEDVSSLKDQFANKKQMINRSLNLYLKEEKIKVDNKIFRYKEELNKKFEELSSDKRDVLRLNSAVQTRDKAIFRLKAENSKYKSDLAKVTAGSERLLVKYRELNKKIAILLNRAKKTRGLLFEYQEKLSYMYKFGRKKYAQKYKEYSIDNAL